MDLLSSIRKSGSRGGVNFSWDEVSTSQHRENYLGHSLMAPVGRWQKGKDLNWYAKADDDKNPANETAEERRVRERKEEIRRIKEAEEDALSRALGLPVPVRNGEGTGSNNIDIGEMRRVIKDTEEGDDEIDEVGKNKGFGDFVGRVQDEPLQASIEQPQQGGLMRKDGEGARPRRERGRDGRDRSRSRERRHRRHRHRSRSVERHRHRRRDDERPERRERSRSGERRDRRYRSRSADRYRSRRDDREPDREPRRDSDRRPRRSRSPDRRDRGSRRDRD